jgi:hypothetical protein
VDQDLIVVVIGIAKMTGHGALEHPVIHCHASSSY